MDITVNINLNMLCTVTSINPNTMVISCTASSSAVPPNNVCRKLTMRYFVYNRNYPFNVASVTFTDNNNPQSMNILSGSSDFVRFMVFIRGFTFTQNSTLFQYKIHQNGVSSLSYYYFFTALGIVVGGTRHLSLMMIDISHAMFNTFYGNYLRIFQYIDVYQYGVKTSAAVPMESIVTNIVFMGLRQISFQNNVPLNFAFNYDAVNDIAFSAASAINSIGYYIISHVQCPSSTYP